tara:strand:- start:2666 stop:4432 length:1767 start_codon:yes stop_codon:yes gene_type:complete
MANNPIYDAENRGLAINYSQLIRFGVCVDNNDPQRSGRIRALLTEGEGVTSSKINDPLKAIEKIDKEGNYKPWSKEDPHTFDPFLPLHINVIPRKSEAIKLISFETVKDNVNQEYLGPMISQPGQIKGDNYSSGQQNTSFGIQNKRLPDFAPEGVPLPEGKGSFPNPDDIALVGRDNCDLVLGMREKSIQDETEQQVEDWYPQILIRSGKLIPNKKFSSRPKFNRKPTFIQLNTFPQKLTKEEKKVTKVKVEDANLNCLIEYYINFNPIPLGPFSGNITVYKLPYGAPNTGKPYLSSEFTPTTLVPPPITTSNPAIPTFLGGIGGQLNNLFCHINFSNIASIEEVSTIINNVINQVDKGYWSELQKPVPNCVKTFNPTVDTNDTNSMSNFFPLLQHPLYFRPQQNVLDRMEKSEPSGGVFPNWQTEKEFCNRLKDLILIEGIDTPGMGLCFTANAGKREVPTTMEETVIDEIKKHDIQQGIVTIGSERIYMFSYDSADINGPIILDTNYGIDQEKFITEIDEKTNSLVRGEKLIELLSKIVNYTTSHTHAYPGMAPVGQSHDGTTIGELTQLLQDAPQTILNQNIRIN